jgi:ABC-type transporter Mla subunit MlaD
MAEGRIRYEDLFAPDIKAFLQELTDTIRKLNDSLDETKKATEDYDKSARSMNDTVQSSVDITDDLLRLTQDEINLKRELAKAQKLLDKAIEEGSADADKYAIAVRRGKEELSKLGFELRNAAKLANTTKGSMEELSLSLAKNRMAYRKLTEEQRKNDKVGGRLLRTITKQDKEIKKLDARIGNHQRNVGKYSSALDGLSSVFGGMGVNIRIVSNSFRTFTSVMNLSKSSMAGMTASAKVLRIALISTGIGAIVVALGTLIAALASSNKFTDWFSEKLAYLKGVIGGVGEFLGQLGDAMVEFFSGNWSEAADIASDAFSNFGETVGKAADESLRLYEAQKKLEELNRNMPVQIAALKVAEENLRKEIEDQNTSAERRVQLAEELRQNIIQQKQLALDAAVAGIKAAKTEDERAAANEAYIRAQAELNVARGKTALDYLNIIKETAPAIDSLESSYDRLLEKERQEEEQLKKLIKARKNYYKALEETFEFEDEEFIPDIEVDTEKIAGDLNTVEEGAISMSQGIAAGASIATSALSGAAEKNKDVQIAQALINTFAAVGVTFAQLGWPAGIAGAAAALAAGLANVAKIASTSVPTYNEGTEYVPLQGNPRGTDTIPAMLNEGERVVPSHINRLLMGVPNEALPSLMSGAGTDQARLEQIARQQLMQIAMTNKLLRGGLRYTDHDGSIVDPEGNKKTYIN